MPLAITHNHAEPSECHDMNDIFLVSDLHMADGRTGPFGKFAQGENFFWDESFERFLRKISATSNGKSQTLVINGDFLDFLRVDRIPDKRRAEDAKHVERWKRFLGSINHPAANSDLYAADKSESEYGLKTNDHKSVWKLLLIFEGHKVFFEALRSFLGKDENKLVILKGNHDLEFHWEAVRQAFAFLLADEDAERYNAFNQRINFYQKLVVINKELHIEHGHVFEPLTYATPDTLPDNPAELLLSVGSLFNRYVINKIEEIEPLFDNIKPPTNILKAVALHYPRKFLKIVFRHLVGAWRIVRKRHFLFAAKIIGKIFSVGLPLLVFVALAAVLYFKLQNAIADDVGRWVLNAVASLLGALAVRWVQSKFAGADSSKSLLSHAKEVYRKNSSLKLITFGHTHTSEMSLVSDDCWYCNSGTWIPNIEINTSKVQDTNTFCVLHVINNNGALQREPLQRWNDERGELERVILFETSARKPAR